MDTQIINAAQAAIIDVNIFFAAVYGIPLMFIAIYYSATSMAFTIGFVWGFIQGLKATPQELTQQELTAFEAKLQKSLSMG